MTWEDWLVDQRCFIMCLLLGWRTLVKLKMFFYKAQSDKQKTKIFLNKVKKDCLVLFCVFAVIGKWERHGCCRQRLRQSATSVVTVGFTLIVGSLITFLTYFSISVVHENSGSDAAISRQTILQWFKLELITGTRLEVNTGCEWACIGSHHNQWAYKVTCNNKR